MPRHRDLHRERPADHDAGEPVRVHRCRVQDREIGALEWTTRGEIPKPDLDVSQAVLDDIAEADRQGEAVKGIIDAATRGARS